MAGRVLFRLLHAVVVIAGVTAAVFFLVRLGGDPTGLFLPPDAPAEDLARFRHQLGFDRPLAAQFASFALAALHGDFGRSLRYEQPALGLVLERLPATLELAATALALSLAVSVPLAIAGARRRGRALDQAGLLLTLLAESFPVFWLAIVLILVFSEWLGWLPPSGRGGLRSLVLPSVSLAAYSTAIVTRLLRSSLIEVLGTDYIRTARAKGLRERAILAVHALRPAAIPVVTVLGRQAGALLGGAVVTEQIFAWPGMGQLVVQSIANRDFAVVQAFVLAMAAVIVAINLAVDLLYTWLDPRLRPA